jgi:hypothetical protein
MIKTLLYSFGMIIVLANFAEAQTAPCPEGYICTIADTNSNVTTSGETTTNVNSPPPSAIAPGINLSNSDLCTVGVSGAVQTQILGISAGKTVRDMNCEKLKNAKTLYDMGMKVAAVSTMCQDPRIFQAMLDAGTPCPFDGMIGEQAKTAWEANPDKIPGEKNGKLFNVDPSTKSTLLGGGGILLLLLGLTTGL